MKQKDLELLKDLMKQLLPTTAEVDESISILIQFQDCSEADKERITPIIKNCITNLIGTVEDRIKALKVN